MGNTKSTENQTPHYINIMESKQSTENQTPPKKVIASAPYKKFNMVFDFDCTLSKKHLFAFTNNWQITSMSRYQNVYNYYTFMKHINTHLSKDDLFAKLEINSNLYWKQGNMGRIRQK